MKAKVYAVLIMLFLSINASAQASEEGQIDSIQQQKFVLSSKNEVASSGKYKRLQIFINYYEEDRTYVIAAHSEREINCYLEIKDQDDNVIYFKPVSIHPGANYLPLETEDGTQTMFKLYFEDNWSGTTAAYVFRFVKEITYSRK